MTKTNNRDVHKQTAEKMLYHSFAFELSEKEVEVIKNAAFPIGQHNRPIPAKFLKKTNKMMVG